MTFFDAMSKLFKRKKRNGYYEASDVLTPNEKQSIFLGFSIIIVPLLISVILIFLN